MTKFDMLLLSCSVNLVILLRPFFLFLFFRHSTIMLDYKGVLSRNGYL
jgi:hypothetical protein